MKADTARALHREAMARRRIKEHTATWWHKQHCPACAAGVPHGLAAGQQQAISQPADGYLPGQVVPSKPTLN